MRALRAVSRVVAGLVGAVVFLLVVELWLAPPDVPMLLLVCAALLATVVFAARLLWPLRVRPNDQRVARLVEERCPDLEDRVATATELEGAGDPAFRQLLVADAAKKLRSLDPGAVVVPTAQLRAAVLRGVVATAALVALLALGGEPIGRVARTAWLVAFPSDLTVVVEPGDVRVEAGQSVRVRVRLGGRVSAPARSLPSLTRWTDEGSDLVEMQVATDGDGYVVDFPSVAESFTYRVSAATVRSPVYRVDAVVAPRIRRVDLEYLYPDFTGLPPRVEEDGGDVYAPAGTAVRVRVYADTPVVGGRLELSDGRRIPLEASGAATRQGTFEVQSDGEYSVSVTNSAGLVSPADARYFIRTTADRAPEVELIRPAGDVEITALEEVTIEARADDDYRIGSLELVYTVAGRAERTVRLGPSDPSVALASVTGDHTLFAEDLALEPGDFITYHVRARDVRYTGPGSEVRSDIFFLEVRPFDQEFEEAPSQSGMGQAAVRVGDLAAVQKEIIVATWRLDALRRNEDVDNDIRAVGRAQAELRDRAARAADDLRGTGPDSAAGQAGPGRQLEAMSAALEAMTAALVALQEMLTATALPYEMEALNQLLKAQAEIRRQQVSSQTSGGQGPGTQAQEDLSALFDRELRRDKETNYETGASSQPGEADVSETLRRLQELAERQSEVNRQLDRSEEAGSDDVRRRALERLTREQQEIREQLEQLAQQLAGAQPRGGGSESGESSASPLDRAAEQMRRAASELRRDDAEQALARGQQAMDELRRLAQQLRGEADDAPAGSVGELASEARQIAEAQRRVAAEAAEVAADNRTADARARLADGKDRLADRVDALGQELRDLAEDDTADLDEAVDADAVDRARNALERVDVGRMMRAAAEGLRTPDGTADPDAEAALTDLLTGVADELGRAADGEGDDTRRLAAQLEAAQELREALQRLSGDEAAATGEPGDPRAEGSPAGEPADAGDGGSAGEQTADLAQPNQEGRSASGTRPSGSGHTAAQLRRQFVGGLEGQPGLLDELRQENPALGRDLDAWAEHWASQASPGTDGFKQDFGLWDSLRRNLETALRRFEDARSRDLATADLRDRVTGEREEPVPARYRRLVDEYYRSLATQRPSPQ